MKVKKEFLIAAGVLVTIGVTGLAVMYRKELLGLVKGQNMLRTRAIRSANEEYNKWNKNGEKIKEHDPRTTDRLEAYWLATKNRYSAMRGQPWSAAFISYIMQKAGAGDNFKYATNHSTYIQEAIRNTTKNEGRVRGYRPENVSIEPGDIICSPRSGSGADYDTTGAYQSHCDICVEVNKRTGIATMIGGNVSDSVSKTNLPITKEGKIDKSKTNKDYFVVIKY